LLLRKSRRSIKDPTYLLTNEGTTYTSLWKMLETNPAPSTDKTTTVTVGKNVTGYIMVEPGVDNDVVLTELPTVFSQKGWRTDLLNGSFEAGTWTFDVKLTGAKRNDIQIYVHARLWKSVNPDGSGAVAVSDWVSSPNLLDMEPTEQQATYVSDSFTVSLPEVTLSNEYLFVEFCIQVYIATPDAVGATTIFVCDEEVGESVTTPTFTPVVVVVELRLKKTTGEFTLDPADSIIYLDTDGSWTLEATAKKLTYDKDTGEIEAVPT